VLDWTGLRRARSESLCRLFGEHSKEIKEWERKASLGKIPYEKTAHLWISEENGKGKGLAMATQSLREEKPRSVGIHSGILSRNE